MIQIYFLSICLNIAAGMILSASYFSERFPVTAVFREFIFKKTGLRIGLTAALILVGIMKIISVTAGDVIIVGDFLPALALLISGGTLLIEYLTEGDEPVEGFAAKLEDIFVKHESITGIVCLVAAVFHFIFPSVLFL